MFSLMKVSGYVFLFCVVWCPSVSLIPQGLMLSLARANDTLWMWFWCAGYRKNYLQLTPISVFFLSFFLGTENESVGAFLFFLIKNASIVCSPMLPKLKVMIVVDLLCVYSSVMSLWYDDSRRLLHSRRFHLQLQYYQLRHSRAKTTTQKKRETITYILAQITNNN